MPYAAGCRANRLPTSADIAANDGIVNGHVNNSPYFCDNFAIGQHRYDRRADSDNDSEADRCTDSNNHTETNAQTDTQTNGKANAQTDHYRASATQQRKTELVVHSP